MSMALNFSSSSSSVSSLPASPHTTHTAVCGNTGCGKNMQMLTPVYQTSCTFFQTFYEYVCFLSPKIENIFCKKKILTVLLYQLCNQFMNLVCLCVAEFLTAIHCLIMQDCFMRPGPPNFFMSLQKWHSPHSVRTHASHFRHRVRRRRAPEEVRLDGSLTAAVVDEELEAAGVVAVDAAILDFGRLGSRC